MTDLLEIREKIKLIYSRNEVFILPVIKFLIAFLTLCIVNGQMGYMTKLDNMALVLIVALFCSFMPTGCITLFAALFSLLHMYALALEAALVGLVVYMLLFLLFIRFTAKDSLAVVFTPIFCVMNIPYVMPIAMGLVGTPASAISVACGVVVYYLIQAVILNAPTINTMETAEVTARLRLLIDGILNNKAMVVMVVAFAITVILVYLIRRMSIDHSWTIAIVAGVIADLIILLLGDLIYDTNISVGGALIGAVLAVAVGKIIEFFRFCVDYSRTEKVQFEDDEYYYYVKAVPKMTVAAPTNTVKKINTQRVTETNRQNPANKRPNTNNSRQNTTSNRSVTTERTAPARTNGAGSRTANQRRDYKGGGKSVTIKSNNAVSHDNDNFEDLF